jgi:cytochrome c-type biogenesis protein CcmH/NrfG
MQRMSRRASLWVQIIVLIVAALAATAPVLKNGFINWDDRDQITLNPDFNPTVRLQRMIEYWRGPRFVGSLYPVSYNLFGALSAIGRTEPNAAGETIGPRPFHVASIVLHLASTLLVFGILRLIVQHDVAACFGAALFAVHPVQIEPIAWVSGMNTLLFAIFSLLAIWQYLLALRRAPRTTARRALVIAATIAFLLALYSKPAAVTVPIIAALLDWLMTRLPWREVAKVPVVWLLAAMPIIYLTRRMQTGELITPTPLWMRPFVAGDALTFYLYKLVFPVRLLVDYGRTPQWVQDHPPTWLGVLMPIALGLIGWRLRKRYPWLPIAFGVFIAALLPVLGLTPFDVQMISTVTDRYLYLAMLAPAMVLAFGLSRTRSQTAFVFVGAILLALLIRSNVRARQWRDEFALFEPELQSNPRSLAAHQVLGVTHAAAGRYELAAEHLTEALQTKPDDPRSLYNLANIQLRFGRHEEAIRLYHAALQKFPDNAKIHNNLGVALAQIGDLDSAEMEFNRALELAPGMPEALLGLKGVALTRSAATKPS